MVASQAKKLPRLNDQKMMAAFLNSLRRQQPELFGKESDELWGQFVAVRKRINIHCSELTTALVDIMTAPETKSALRARFLTCLFLENFYNRSVECGWLPCLTMGSFGGEELRRLCSGLDESWKHWSIRLLLDFASYIKKVNLSGRYPLDDYWITSDYWKPLDILYMDATPKEQELINMATPTLVLGHSMVYLCRFHEKSRLTLNQKTQLLKEVRQTVEMLLRRNNALLANEEYTIHFLGVYLAAASSCASEVEVIPHLEFILMYSPDHHTSAEIDELGDFNGRIDSLINWLFQWAYDALLDLGEETRELREKLILRCGKDQLLGQEVIDAVCEDFPEHKYLWTAEWRARVQKKSDECRLRETERKRIEAEEKNATDKSIRSIIEGWQALSVND